MITRAARHTVRVLITTAGILLILIAVLSATVRLGLPLLAGYKGEVETRVSEYLKSPVDIGELSLRWKGFGPLLHAQSVAVLESEQRQVTLDELLIDLNLFKSLMRGAPVINELTLVGANLAIEADTNGSLRVHGMEPARVKRVTASMGKAASSGKGTQD